MQSVVKIAEKIIDAPLPSVESIYSSCLEATSKRVNKDQFNPAHNY